MIREVTFSDIKDENSFQPVLPDRKHLTAGDMLTQEHRILGWVLWGGRECMNKVRPSPGLDKQLVFCMLFAVQPDTERAGVELVDFVDPEREFFCKFLRYRPDVNTAHALCCCHGVPNYIWLAH